MGSAQSARRNASARDEARDAHRGAGSQLRRWRAILPYLGGAREVAPQLDPFVALPREVAVAIFTRLSYTSRIRLAQRRFPRLGSIVAACALCLRSPFAVRLI
jgi:hypothetical protein